MATKFIKTRSSRLKESESPPPILTVQKQLVEKVARNRFRLRFREEKFKAIWAPDESEKKRSSELRPNSDVLLQDNMQDPRVIKLKPMDWSSWQTETLPNRELRSRLNLDRMVYSAETGETEAFSISTWQVHSCSSQNKRPLISQLTVEPGTEQTGDLLDIKTRKRKSGQKQLDNLWLLALECLHRDRISLKWTENQGFKAQGILRKIKY